ncbi:MAG TPA: hypothetical protein VHQ90_24880 [Thermoanaerobaculia bacterium]|nr:hypothetical protein [Thermoanaerobaculia bacterium]
MRTTIELKDEHRAKLVELAARRGEKGFSAVVAEAIEAYFETLAKQKKGRRAALRLKGSLTAEEADELRDATRLIRDSWR